MFILKSLDIDIILSISSSCYDDASLVLSRGKRGDRFFDLDSDMRRELWEFGFPLPISFLSPVCLLMIVVEWWGDVVVLHLGVGCMQRLSRMRRIRRAIIKRYVHPCCLPNNGLYDCQG